MAEQLETLMSRDKVEAALNKIRPHLQADGGDVKLIDVKEGVVTVKLTGACAGCPMSTMTLRAGVARVLRQELPDMKKLVAV